MKTIYSRITQWLVVLLLAALTTACSSGGGEAFEGVWQSTKNPDELLSISRVDGTSFRIDATKPNYAGGPRIPIQVSATLRDGALIPAGWGGAVAIMHLSESDMLSAQRPLGGTILFTRIR